MKHVYLFLFTILSFGLGLAQDIGVIPQPQQVEKREGSFVWSSDIEVSVMHMYGNLQPDRTDYLKQIRSLVAQGIKTGSKQFITYKNVKSLNIDENSGQAYRLTIGCDEIVVEATTEAGFFNATQTLRQLYRFNALKNANGNLFETQWQMTRSVGKVEIPCMVITDWPNLEYRGWLDDISRGPIPTMDFLKKEIEILSYYKLNFFNLYTEHVFKLDSHPDIAPTDGLTADEIAELTAYARRFNIELIGNQQCFAHAEKTLRIPFYVNIKDGSANLNPNSADTYSFLNDVFSEVAPAYESPLFNINCDETEGLGSGLARDYVDEIGAEEAYIRHINSVYNILNLYNKQVMMWGDIVAKSPDMLDKLPEDMRFIVWSYVSSPDFGSMIEPFAKSGHKFWVAPGVSMWSKCFPDIETYIVNIANLVRDGYLAGAEGMMNTAWDDSGESLFNSAWHGMAWGAEMSWNSLTDRGKKGDSDRTEREKAFNRNFDIQFFGCPKPSFTSYLYRVNNLQNDKNIGPLINFSALNEPLLDFYPSKVDSTAYSSFIQYKPADDEYNYMKGWNAFFERPANAAPSALVPDRIAVHILNNAEVAAERMRLTARKNIARILLYRSFNDPTEENIRLAQNKTKQVFDDLYRLKCDYIKLWDRECRAYSRDIVTNRYDKLATELLDADKHVFISTELNGENKPVVTLKTVYSQQKIYYTTDGSKPSEGSTLYTEPFVIEQSCLVRAVCFDQTGDRFDSEKHILNHKAINCLKVLTSDYSTYNPTYSGGGEGALLDGVLGSDYTYADGHWQGFQGQDIGVIIDLKKKTVINSVEMRFLQNTFDWILSPQQIEVWASNNADSFTLVASEELNPDFRKAGNIINHACIDLHSTKARYLQVIIKNPGVLPDWHPAKGYDSYIFCDEIVVK